MDPSDYQKDPRPPVQSQLSTSLPGPMTYITTTDPDSGKSIFHSKRQADWKHFSDKQMGMNQVYTSAFAADMNDEKDIDESDKLIGGGKLGLVREGGSMVRYVDFSPSYESIMHRTVSCDIGVVVEGTMEMILDDGSKSLMRVGDTAVQRGTMHAWRNPSTDTWARMVFVLNHTQPLKIADKELGEDLDQGVQGLPASGSAH